MRAAGHGDARMLYDYYARVFSAAQQLGKVGTFHGLDFANTTMTFKELIFWDTRWSQLVSRKEVQVWNQNREEHSLDGGEDGPKRIGKEVGFEGFKKILVAVALLNAATPDGRIRVLGETAEERARREADVPSLLRAKQVKTAADVVEALVQFLELDDRPKIRSASPPASSASAYAIRRRPRSAR